MDIINISYELSDLLLNSKEYIKLKACESKMLSDDKCKFLIDEYKRLEVLYASNQSSEMLKKLHHAKLKMDLHRYVISYKKAYKKYQILTGKITDVAFDGFYKKNLIDEIERIK